MKATIEDFIQRGLIEHMAVASFALLTRDYDLSLIEKLVNKWSDTLMADVHSPYQGGDMDYVRSESAKVVEDLLTVIRRVRGATEEDTHEAD
jgi:hypothetical protein